MLYKIGALKNSAKLSENSCVRVSFITELHFFFQSCPVKIGKYLRGTTSARLVGDVLRRFVGMSVTWVTKLRRSIGSDGFIEFWHGSINFWRESEIRLGSKN